MALCRCSALYQSTKRTTQRFADARSAKGTRGRAVATCPCSLYRGIISRSSASTDTTPTLSRLDSHAVVWRLRLWATQFGGQQAGAQTAARVHDREPVMYSAFFTASSATQVIQQEFANAWYIVRTQHSGRRCTWECPLTV